MWVHTGSPRIAALGMTMITISLPLALALYAPFVPFFTQLHILAVFIILGVGADDIFVFVDGWRQSGRMIVPKTDDAHGRRAVLVRRMTFTYRRTASAVFNTSFTTATAFFGTAVSPVMPIAAFGVFAALAIVMNYVWSARGGPPPSSSTRSGLGARAAAAAAARVPQLKVEDGCGAMIGLGCSDPKKKKVETTATKKAAVDDDAAALARLGRSERFFHVHYSRWITWSPPSLKGAKPVALFLAISLSGAGGLLSWRATRLEAPAEQEVFFPSDHMFTGLGDLMRDQFLTGSEDQYERGKLYVGLAGLHQPPEYTRWKPDKNRGAAVWDDQFDLSVSRRSSPSSTCAKSPHRAVRRARVHEAAAHPRRAGHRRVLHGIVCQPLGRRCRSRATPSRPRCSGGSTATATACRATARSTGATLASSTAACATRASRTS